MFVLGQSGRLVDSRAKDHPRSMTNNKSNHPKYVIEPHSFALETLKLFNNVFEETIGPLRKYMLINKSTHE